MKESLIRDPVANSVFSIWQQDDFEKINPVDFFKESYMKILISLWWQSTMMEIKIQGIPFDKEAFDKATPILKEKFEKKALEDWDKKNEEFLNMPLPHGLFQILDNCSKKEQMKALKGITLTGDEINAFYMRAYLTYGYTLSHYVSTHHLTGLDKTDLPPFILKDNDEIRTIGKSNLSEGQIKQALEQRRVIVSKFLDKGDSWHCFFLSYRSLSGAETAYKGGEPHLHFISHTWGLSREEVLTQLKSREYKLPSFHIGFKMR